MQPDQDLINRYYQGTCTPQEAQQVMNWLLQNETDLSLTHDWSAASTEGNYPTQYESEMLAAIQQATHPAIRVHRMHWVRWAVAATVMVAVSLATLLLQRRHQPASVAQVTPVTATQQPRAMYAPAHHPSTIRMIDGSTVVLEPGAVLHYDAASYNQHDRVVSLEGKAVFFVAHNTGKPFSVKANGYSTTALGTSFLVAAQPTGNLRVQLFTGKVVIRRLQNTQPATKDVYLTPGEEMALVSRSEQPVVSRWLSDKGIARENGSTMIAQTKAVRMVGDTLVFNNAPLAKVLDVLKHRYEVDIQYDRRHVASAYFTGSVLPGDAIELMLKTVTRINGLTLIAAGDGFIIR